MPREVRLAVVGLGHIGQVHLSKIMESDSVRLVAVSDPTPGRTMTNLGVPNRADYRELLADRLDGVVVAVPNALHREIGVFFASSGIHVLMEKPLAESVAAGRDIVAAARDGGVYLLVGHHRRHNRLIPATRRLVQEEIGRLLATNSLLALRKPDSYYDEPWRRGPEAGPLLVNVIHEIDNLRTICGEITEVQSLGSRVARGFEFDDTLAIGFRYESGAVGSMTVSESTPSPWSWETSVAEGLGFPQYGQDNTVFLGSEGSISFPSLRLWHFEDPSQPSGWNSPLTSSERTEASNDPYLAQIEDFARVIREQVPPVVEGSDALRSLAVIEAIREAGVTGSTVRVEAV